MMQATTKLGAAMGDCVQVKSAEIADCVSDIEGSIVALDNTVDNILSRLVMVLRSPIPENACEGGGGRLLQTPLGNDLNTLTLKLRAIDARLTDGLHRLEL